MAVTATVETTRDAVPAGTDWPIGLILRDISRGGLAGLFTGFLVGGVGGRLAMRFAALAVPEATGSATQNGNRVGDITLEGSVALLVFIGAFAGVGIAFFWVTVSPWIPGRTLVRALLTAPLAIAFGAFGLFEIDNPDFIILGHSPTVVGILLVTIALAGLVVSLTDSWLERRLPYAERPGSRAATGYLVLTALGLLLAPLLVLPFYLTAQMAPLTLILTIVGLATIAWWVERWRGAARPSKALVVVGRGALSIATVVGAIILWPAISAALGLA
jgi:hypothetical protein